MTVDTLLGRPAPPRTAQTGAATITTPPGATAPASTGSAGAAAGQSTGPLRRVLAAIESGAAERAELRRMTGLGDEALDAALVLLVRLGHVQADSLSASCPPSGCTACPGAKAAACGGIARRSGAPVALSLAGRPRG